MSAQLQRNYMVTHLFLEPQIKNESWDQEDPIIKAIVEEMNQKFAVLEQPTFLILEENNDGTFLLDKKQSLRDRFGNQSVDLRSGKKKNKADIFLASPKRRTFRRIVMNPKVIGHYQENGVWFYNLWKGFAFEAKQGCCEKIKKHIREIICTGNESHYEFLMNLLGYWVQKPESRTVALLLRGPQGCGKNIFVDAIGKLFGKAYGVYDDVERLLGKFNSDLATKILIFADEALWGGRKGDAGKLKAAITGDSLWLEQKGKDKIEIPNFRKFIAASNERFALPLDADDRRWLVLDCSGARVRDSQYFNDILEELKGEGYEAFLYELLNRDLSDFNPNVLPLNDNAFDLKLQCSSSFLQYIYAVLCCGKSNPIDSRGFSWTEVGMVIRADVLRSDYADFCSKEKLPFQGDKECGWVLRNLFQGAKYKKSRIRYAGERFPTYTFDAISKSQQQFAAYFRISELEAIFPKEEEE